MHVAAARRCRQHAQRTIEKAHETSCFIQAHRNASATAAMRDLRDGHVTCDERKAQEDDRSTSPGGAFPALHKPECAKLRKKQGPLCARPGRNPNRRANPSRDNDASKVASIARRPKSFAAPRRQWSPSSTACSNLRGSVAGSRLPPLAHALRQAAMNALVPATAKLWTRVPTSSPTPSSSSTCDFGLPTSMRHRPSASSGNCPASKRARVPRVCNAARIAAAATASSHVDHDRTDEPQLPAPAMLIGMTCRTRHRDGQDAGAAAAGCRSASKGSCPLIRRQRKHEAPRLLSGRGRGDE